MNRKKIIEDLESFRQGFWSAKNLFPRSGDEMQDKVFMTTMSAYHQGIDRLIVELGGESTIDE